MLELDRKIENILLQGKKINDGRGWFYVPINIQELQEIGIEFSNVCQLNHSFTHKSGVIRGLNYQSPPYQQSKIVRCVRGKVYSVAVDIDKKSDTYGQWCGFMLSEENMYLHYVPNHFAHGFITMENNTEIEYLTDNLYSFSHAKSVLWSDQGIGIDWTCGGLVEIESSIISEKNRNAELLKNIDFS